MAKRIGERTVLLENRPSVQAFAAVVGKKEGSGPLRNYFDRVFRDTAMQQKSWEKAESQLQTEAVSCALAKAGLKPTDIQVIFAGDLINQCTASTFALRDLEIPFLGQYGACSTMAQTLAMAAIFAEGGFAERAVAVTSSHFCSAERQFRFPLEYGSLRTPTAQWTVTGSGAAVVGCGGKSPYIDAVTVGKIVDLGVCDVNNMGAAMAPAAADTISAFFRDTGTRPEEYDVIVTGDLGFVGSELLYDLLNREGYDIRGRHADCGLMIFDREVQQVNAGGSGCGCAASVLCGYFLPRLQQGKLKNVLFTATGALLSTTSAQQGESIPGIAHLLRLRSDA